MEASSIFPEDCNLLCLPYLAEELSLQGPFVSPISRGLFFLLLHCYNLYLFYNALCNAVAFIRAAVQGAEIILAIIRHNPKYSISSLKIFLCFETI